MQKASFRNQNFYFADLSITFYTNVRHRRIKNKSTICFFAWAIHYIINYIQ